LALLAIATAAGSASATTFSQGHGDIGLWYEPDRGYELKLSNGADWQADPGLATIVVSPQSRETVPTTLATTGSWLSAGSPLWKLPQSATEAATEGSPWLGMQVHGGPLGSTAAATASARLSLELVASSGPGLFVMWQDIEPNLYGLGGPGGPGFESRPDLLVSPGAAFNSAIAGGNHINCWHHMHTHANWGFTAPGEYFVTFNATGETAEDGTFSNSATFRFLVLEATPVTPPLGDLTGDGVVNRADFARFTQSFGTQSGATRTTGDFDSDGSVGLRDLVLMRNALGGPIGPPTTTGNPATTLELSSIYSGAPAAIPEPSSLLLAGSAIVASTSLVRRRKRK
jgi:surface-anchored protein